MRIRIKWQDGEVVGVLDDTPTSRKLFEALPFASTANTWGEEVYFETPIQAELEAQPQVVVPQGTICFWVQGSSVALPFGPTPISVKGECRLVTAVNVLGKIDGDPKVLASMRNGQTVTVEPAK